MDERTADYRRDPAADHFDQAAERTAAYRDGTSSQRRQPLGPTRTIRGIWFRSNDEQFGALYSFDRSDASADIVNRIGDEFCADQRAAAQHEEIKTREARARDPRLPAGRPSWTGGAVRAACERAFSARPGLREDRLGTTVTAANFALLQDVRTNPFHYREPGVAIVRTQFNRMVADNVALFGKALAPISHIGDVDRLTRPAKP